MAQPEGGFRRGVGIVLLDQGRRIWVGQRQRVGGWHMPQGGLLEGEGPGEGAFRELGEEVGTSHATFLAEHPEWLSYVVPEELRPASWQGRYVGQTQKWLCLRFDGDDAEIDLAAQPGVEPEFRAWRWATPSQVIADAPGFKRELYPRVLAAFGAWL